MEFVKFIFGTAMIGLALFYARPIMNESAFYLIFGSATVLISSYFGAFLPNEKLSGLGKLRKGSMVAMFLVPQYGLPAVIVFSVLQNMAACLYNVSYLIDVLDNMGQEMVQINLLDSNSSALITVPESARFKYVVMPMRL